MPAKIATSAPTLIPVAYSYGRFSHPSQSTGDSIRRQDDEALAWCQRNQVPLDKTLTLRDKGVSAFTGEHRKNPDRHALAMFIKWVERDRVRPGDYLIVENLDRLSREDLWPALDLVASLVRAGVRIVQLTPVEQIIDQNATPMTLMMVIMELSRGHSESKMKSDRIGKAWGQKKQNARANGELLTHLLPTWIEERDGKLHLIPERVAALKRIYALARNGYGASLILKQLLSEGVPAFGRRLTAADAATYAQRREQRDKPPPTAKEIAALKQRIGTFGRWDDGEWVPAQWARATI